MFVSVREAKMGTLAAHATRYLMERRGRQEITRASAMRTSYTLMSLDKSFGDRPIGSFSGRAVERWLEDNPQWQTSTRATYMAQVRMFCKWLLRRHLIASDPFAEIRAPRRPRPAPQTLTRDDIAALLAYIPDARGKLIVHLQWGLGLRCCGCANLRVEDIDLGRRTMYVTEKGGHARRLPLTNEVLAAMERYLFEYPARSGPLLRSYSTPWAGISASHVSFMVARWMSAAGVKRRPNDGRSAHALRRTALTEVAEATGDAFVVQELAGWASPAYAANYVVAASTERVRAALEAR
jgi:integrase